MAGAEQATLEPVTESRIGLAQLHLGWAAAAPQHGAEKIVLLGGGAGLSGVVEGLSNEPYTGVGVTAIVTSFDDGGGTGALRRRFGIPGVGDVGLSLLAMSGLSEKGKAWWDNRYEEGAPSDDLLHIEGQTPRNLFIASAILSEMRAGGNFTSALTELGKQFQVKGRVLPVSDDIRNLRFELPDGRILHGEHEADEAEHIKSLLGTNIRFVNPHTNRLKVATISEEVEAAIEEADLVVLAPGDLYTSIGPNLAVRGMREAIRRARARIMISNLMNKSYGTDQFTTLMYAQEYERILGEKFIDRILVNIEPLDEQELARQWDVWKSTPVEPDFDGLKKAGYEVRTASLVSPVVVAPKENDKVKRSGLRHGSFATASNLHNIFVQNGFSNK